MENNSRQMKKTFFASLAILLTILYTSDVSSGKVRFPTKMPGKYVTPQAIELGDTLGVVVLGWRVDPSSDTAKIRQVFDSLGYALKFGTHLMEQSNPAFGASDRDRASDFMEMIENKNIKAVIMY